jgi:hypothetical protein
MIREMESFVAGGLGRSTVARSSKLRLSHQHLMHTADRTGASALSRIALIHRIT